MTKKSDGPGIDRGSEPGPERDGAGDGPGKVRERDGDPPGDRGGTGPAEPPAPIDLDPAHDRAS